MADAVIPLLEESAHVTKRAIPTEHIRVRTVVETREDLVADTLEREALHIERRTVERQVDAPPPPRDEGDMTIISLVEERLIVTRALFVVEEVVLRRTTETEPVEIPVTLRATRAIVDHHSLANEQENF